MHEYSVYKKCNLKKKRAVRIRWNIDRREADRIRVCRVEYGIDNCDTIVIILNYFGMVGGMSEN